MNITRAARALEQLAARGVAEWCVCPGGRNAALVLLLERARGVRVYHFFEERSAAFFALGRARATGRPVAVVTTSGTAAAELLPAAVEAHYSGAPLALLTADRPPAYRGTGAPQAIEQVGLYGRYAPTHEEELGDWEVEGPVHLNLCFDEPVVDGEVPALSLQVGAPPARDRAPNDEPVRALLERATRPLVIVSTLARSETDGVRHFLTRLAAPVYLEATSGLRNDATLAPLALAGGDAGLATLDPDAVLRIGGVPTTRFWRDLETRFPAVPVCHVTPTGFPGLTRGSVVRGRPGRVLASVTPPARPVPAWLTRDRDRAAAIVEACEAEPAAEPALIRALSRVIPDGALIYLGNSLPVREWDLAAVREPRRWDVRASRGANGIDGQLSTFLGHVEPGREHWALVGDLTALYDLAAPWILPQLEGGPIRIVIVNNGGGQIFARLSPHAALRNAHGVRFADWARQWGLAYQRWTSVPDKSSLEARVVIELAPDAAATDRWWRRHDALGGGA